jgi:hypothetical protein
MVFLVTLAVLTYVGVFPNCMYVSKNFSINDTIFLTYNVICQFFLGDHVAVVFMICLCGTKLKSSILLKLLNFLVIKMCSDW